MGQRTPALEFYATPTEQLTWLRDLLQKAGVWCVDERARREPSCRRLEGKDLPSLEFTAQQEYEWHLFVGRESLTPAPFLRRSSTGRDIMDFASARAVQILPSLLVGPDILLEGQIGILRASQYRELGLDFSGLMTWLAEVKRSLRKACGASHTLTQLTSTGITKEWRDVLVSPGAAEHWRAGGKLKQFPAGAVEFGVRTRAAPG